MKIGDPPIDQLRSLSSWLKETGELDASISPAQWEALQKTMRQYVIFLDAITIPMFVEAEAAGNGYKAIDGVKRNLYGPDRFADQRVDTEAETSSSAEPRPPLLAPRPPRA